MNRAEPVQLNIRSRYARARAAELARATGMTTAQVVEEALRAFTPPHPQPPGKLKRKGRLLVRPGGDRVSLDEANEALEASRAERA